MDMSNPPPDSPLSPPRSASMSLIRAELARQLITATSSIGFDNKKYIETQKKKILERLSKSDNKLYIEFGGKLLFDFHAARVLPGYDPNVKIHLLSELSSDCDIILCVNADDIEHHKVRADFGITYHEDVMKMIDDLRNMGILITAVVITQFTEQPGAKSFKQRLENRDILVYTHPKIPGYPDDLDTIVSDNGYGKCTYIETTKRIVVVTAPGPGSGKLATCLSQLYHEYRRGVKAGYAKFETFPVWNIPLKHPINVAYEAATLDLNDNNLIDGFHKAAYGVQSVNYNRDIAAYPLLKCIMERITNGECPYKSPTDMGVNCIADGIVNENICCDASKQEIIRRYFRCLNEFSMGSIPQDTIFKAKELMDEVGVNEKDRDVVPQAREAAEEAKLMPGKGNHGIYCGAAIRLPTGEIIKGRNSPYLHSASAVIISAAKKLAEIPEDMKILSPQVLDSIALMKSHIYHSDEPSLDVTELLIALSVVQPMNTSIDPIMKRLPELYGCEMHLTHIPSTGDENGLRKLGIRFTYDPNHSSRNLFNL
ncbi:hypothetical protein TRFO_17966 [Tritrichomonas foetus]|uniref:ATP-dependent Zn protease n=1 Tax=Tritrichomonas foetus TaxID=1144522 RepID=A0A1J4KLU1_9EUKA|nr:hypothetical protein TRFO_17966 [Tritrichomonas foetus]|eukprot:OHT12279.1 hypothetical protein TRFO_17966 [Tritrichomonas foetus]